MAISSTRPAFEPAAVTGSEKRAAAMSQRTSGAGADDDDENVSLQTAMHASTHAQGASAVQVDARRFRANQGRSWQPKDSAQKVGWLQWLQFWAPSSSPVLPLAVADQVLKVSLVSAALGILIGLVLPRALYVLSPHTTIAILTNPKLWLSWGNSAVQRAAAVGRPSWREVLSLPQLHVYLLSWACFHLLEFLVTAKYNATRLYDDSFILNNGLAYYVAHVFGLVEFVTEAFLLPAKKQLCLLNYVGVVLILLGQLARSLAMVHASSNFSHAVAYRKRPDHELVTSGVYSLSRHPSYFGFFCWAVGTQLLLGNPVGACGYAAVLWNFFANRIRGEEKYLVEFFGEEYIAYRKRVTTLIPFLR